MTFSLTHPHLNQLSIELIGQMAHRTLIRNRNNPNGSTNMVGNQPAGLPDQADIGSVNGRAIGTTFNQKAFRPLNTTVGNFRPVAPYVGTYLPEQGSLAIFNGLTPDELNGVWRFSFTDYLFDGIDPAPDQFVTGWTLKLSSRVAQWPGAARHFRVRRPAQSIPDRARHQCGFHHALPGQWRPLRVPRRRPGVVVAVDNTLGSSARFKAALPGLHRH